MTKRAALPTFSKLAGSLLSMQLFLQLMTNASFSFTNIISTLPLAMILFSVFGQKKDILLVISLGLNVLIYLFALRGFGIWTLISLVCLLGYLFLACVFVFDALEKFQPIVKKFWYAPVALETIIYIIKTIINLTRGGIPDVFSLFIVIISFIACFLLSLWIVFSECKVVKFQKPASFQEVFKSQTFKRFVAILVVVVLGIGVLSLVTSGGGGGGNGSTCKFCGRSFTDSGNNLSIARTGMCSNCAGNYKSFQGVLGN